MAPHSSDPLLSIKKNIKNINLKVIIPSKYLLFIQNSALVSGLVSWIATINTLLKAVSDLYENQIDQRKKAIRLLSTLLSVWLSSLTLPHRSCIPSQSFSSLIFLWTVSRLSVSLLWKRGKANQQQFLAWSPKAAGWGEIIRSLKFYYNALAKATQNTICHLKQYGGVKVEYRDETGISSNLHSDPQGNTKGHLKGAHSELVILWLSQLQMALHMTNRGNVFSLRILLYTKFETSSWASLTLISSPLYACGDS